MARKYEYIPGSGIHAWNLEKCEEEIFIAVYVETRDLIPPGETWLRRLEHYFFERGEGLGFDELNEFNAVRNRHGLGRVEFRETDVGDYARSRDKVMKSQRRSQIREEVTDASAEVLAERRAQKEAEEKRQLPPHYTHDEFLERKRQQNAAAPLSREEVAERGSACRAAEPFEVIPIGVRMPPSSEKRAKFQRLLPGRTEKVLTAIHQLANLSSQNYEFEEAEFEKNFDTILHRVEEARERFRRRLTKRSRLTAKREGPTRRDCATQFVPIRRLDPSEKHS
jgi:hypothetical protein